MIFKVFIAFAAVMSRLHLSDKDVEIVIRCRTPDVERDLENMMNDEMIMSGRDFIITDEMLKGEVTRRTGRIYGVPFRIMAW